MFLGKQVRLNRLTNAKSGKFVAITVDHAIARGVLPGIVNMKDTIAKVAAGKPDAMTMHKGIAENLFWPYAGKIPLILKATSFAPYHRNYDTPVADVEEALRFGADAISIGVIVGEEGQAAQLTHLAKISKEAQAAGMPLVSHIYPRGSAIKDQKDPDAVAYAVRAAAELGVDIIKTNWNGSAAKFHKAVLAASPARVVIAGGSAGETIEAYLQMTYEGMEAGIFGVTFGRFVWEDTNPARAIAAVKAIIHDGADVGTALKLYREMSSGAAA